MWAVIANRTLLWAYDDGGDGENAPSTSTNTTTTREQQCANVLQVPSWIPSYTRWSTELRLPDLFDLSRNEERYKVPPAILLSHPSTAVDDTPVVLFPSQPYKIRDLDLKTANGRPWIPLPVEKLYKQGADFLYGMLFEQTILLADIVQIGIPAGSKAEPESLTIALDAWNFGDDDGDRETACLEQIWSTTNSSFDKGCFVYVMSESSQSKTATDRIADWLSHRNCSNWTTSTDSQPDGADFFRNLILASKARTALVGRDQSVSSELLASRIEYQRQQEIWRLGRNPPLIPQLHACFVAAD